MSGSQEGLQRSIDTIFDDDDDDELYEPATDGDDDGTSISFVSSVTGESQDGADADEELESDFADAQETIQLEVEEGDLEYILEQIVGGSDDDGEETETEAAPATSNTAATAATTATVAPTATASITLERLHALIASRGALHNYILTYGNAARRTGAARREIESDEEEEEDDDDIFYSRRMRHRKSRKRGIDSDRFGKVPNPAGRDLQCSGVFGNTDTRVEKLIHRKSTLSQRLLWRRLGQDRRSTASRHSALIAQEMIPNTSYADSIIHYDSRAYSGQFSDDGNFFFSCTQNFKVQMYDTSNPFDWKYYKTVDFPYGQWTITDATLSPDNKLLAYSSIRNQICLAPTDPSIESDLRSGHTLLDFANYAPGANVGGDVPDYRGRGGFGIWSLRFSGDGREIVAGTSNQSVLVYDLERRQTVLKLRKHRDDVNAVCFGDKSSPHILFSGSDDQTIRVWDRRSMADGREAGVFVGHTEGLTYVDSKGDGRYVLSNGKDQTMKLWDLRKMVSPRDFENMNISQYSLEFDYRFNKYDLDDWEPNPHDCSVTTFRGHSVLKTLIRCHFSPPGSTNSRYVYSGSEDGKVYIWNLDGTQKATIDVGGATRDTRPRMSRESNDWDWDMGYNSSVWKTCVRDASWNPNVPVIAATSWNGWGMTTGTVSVHSWNDSTFVPSSLSSDPQQLSPKQKMFGAVDGYWIDNEDDGDPDMGQSYTATLREPTGYRPARPRNRNSGRGLRSNPVRRRRYGEDGEEAGW